MSSLQNCLIPRLSYWSFSASTSASLAACTVLFSDNSSFSKKASRFSSYYQSTPMAFWQVCLGFARFLHKRSARVQESKDIGTRCNRTEVLRVSFPLKMNRSLLSKDLPTSAKLSVSVFSVSPVIPRLFDVRRCRLFGCQLANFSYHFSFAFTLPPIFIRTIIQDPLGFLITRDIILTIFPNFCITFIFAIWLLAAVPRNGVP